MDCIAHVPSPGPGDTAAEQTLSLTTNAPARTETGSNFDTLAQPDESQIPFNLQGTPIVDIRDFYVYIPIPAGATRVSESIVGGGHDYGGATSVTYQATSPQGPRWQFYAPGPIAGGQVFQFPQIKFTTTASGSSGTTIQPKIGGNSVSNPGFKLTARVDAGTFAGILTVPTDCWPKTSLPNPALASTLIIPTDNTAPTVTITSPANGSTVPLDSTVPFQFSCDDGPNGLGVNVCTNSVGSPVQGGAINTATIGPKTVCAYSTDWKPNGGSGSPTCSTYTVVNEDEPTIQVLPTTATEGSNQVFQVKLSRPPKATAPLSVTYQTANGSAVSGTDYTAAGPTVLNFAATDVVKTVSIPTVNRAGRQGNRSFSLNLSSGVNGSIVTASANADIIDDETFGYTTSGSAVLEDTGAVVPFKVSLAEPPQSAIAVTYNTVNGTAVAGTDFTNTFGTLNFVAGGPQEQTINVPVIDNNTDIAPSDSRAFTMSFNGPGGAQTANGTIVDDDPVPPVPANVGVNLSSTKVVEGDVGKRSAYLIARLEAPQATPVTFLYTTVAGTASPGTDYVAETLSLSFPAGTVAKAISIGIPSDTANEGDEQFTVQIQNVTGGPAMGSPTGAVTILDDDNPTNAAVVASMGDVSVWEGDANTTSGAGGQVDLSLFLNRKAVDDVTVNVAIVPGSATSGTDYQNRAPFNSTFKTGNLGNKQLQFKVYGDSVPEGDEYFDVQITLISGTAVIGKSTGRVWILDDDQVPTAPLSLTATQRTTDLGDVDLAWNAPATDGGRPIFKYQYRVSTDGGSLFGPWTDTGTDRRLVHNCGLAVTCLYEVRAVNGTANSPASNQATATGLNDTDFPNLRVKTPANGQNRDNGSVFTFNGQQGNNLGDNQVVSVNVYACNGCTNIAPLYSLSATITGGSWSQTLPAVLPTGIYTAKISQSDWNGHTTDVVRTLESRNAVFVSPEGVNDSATAANDANAGTADAPKKTVAAAALTAVAQGKEVVSGVGYYSQVTLTSAHNGRTIRGSFGQYLGWTRSGTSGLAGTPSKNGSKAWLATEPVTLNGVTGLVLESWSIKGLTAGSPAGASVYGVRVVGGAVVTLNNDKIEAEAGMTGTTGSTGSNFTGTAPTQGANGPNGAGGSFFSCPGGSTGGAGGAGGAGSGRNGGQGGNGACNANGNPGANGVVNGGGGGTGWDPLESTCRHASLSIL